MINIAERIIGVHLTTFAAQEPGEQPTPELRETVLTAKTVLALCIERKALIDAGRDTAKVDRELRHQYERFSALVILARESAAA